MQATAMNAASGSGSTVLGKRKRVERISKENLVLLLSGGSSADEAHFDEYEEQEDEQSNTPKKLKTGNRKYACSFEGCQKSYSKPSRLKEHERAHMGERPFACSECPKTYLRENHLQAHKRVHLPSSERSHKCPEGGCGKAFWTAQHLAIHASVHRGELAFPCPEPNCYDKFSKHHQLRTHIVLVHCPKGTKPYRCMKEGCEKSFATSQKLRAHGKVHDENRYTCTHPTCQSNPTQTFFQTWSALLSHNRLVHPPTCPYVECNNRTFSASKNLRAHLRVHREREVEDSLMEGGEDEGGETEGEEDGEGKGLRGRNGGKKKRRGGEIGRDWICEEAGCEKAFKSKKALKTHHHITHLKRRDFLCRIKGCGRDFGYRHLLKRHVERDHKDEDGEEEGSGSENDSEREDEESKRDVGSRRRRRKLVYVEGEQEVDEDEDEGREEGMEEDDGEQGGQEDGPSNGFSIDFITGADYTQPSTSTATSRGKARTIRCPYPSMEGFTHLRRDSPLNTTISPCKYLFGRAYDLHRHLRAVHGIEVGNEKERWWASAVGGAK